MNKAVFVAIVAASLCVPALAAGKMFYGSRAGMTVTVVSMSGINGRNAVIRTKHTREDAVSFCREYVLKVTPKCVADEMAVRLIDEIHGECASGRFVDFFGEEHQFLGPRKASGDGVSAKYAIKDLGTGELEDGSSGSGYGVNIDIYRALCPAKAPQDE